MMVLQRALLFCCFQASIKVYCKGFAARRQRHLAGRKADKLEPFPPAALVPGRAGADAAHLQLCRRRQRPVWHRRWRHAGSCRQRGRHRGGPGAPPLCIVRRGGGRAPPPGPPGHRLWARVFLSFFQGFRVLSQGFGPGGPACAAGGAVVGPAHPRGEPQSCGGDAAVQ